MDKETKALIDFYDNKIKDLEDKNKEKQDKLNKVEEKNKALMLLLEWMTECDFGLDNIFNEEDINMTEEQFEKITENMEYNESLIYYAELYLKEKINNVEN